MDGVTFVTLWALYFYLRMVSLSSDSKHGCIYLERETIIPTSLLWSVFFPNTTLLLKALPATRMFPSKTSPRPSGSLTSEARGTWRGDVITAQPFLVVFWLSFSNLLLLLLKFLFIDFRKREERRERNIDLLFHLLMHSLVDSCMRPDWGSNLQP